MDNENVSNSSLVDNPEVQNAPPVSSPTVPLSETITNLPPISNTQNENRLSTPISEVQNSPLSTSNPRKIKISVIVLIFILAIGVALGLYYFLRVKKQDNSVESQSRPLSSSEWQIITASAQQSFVPQKIEPLLSMASQKIAPSTDEVSSFYKSVDSLLDVKPQENTAKVATVSSKLKVQFGLKINGQIIDSSGNANDLNGSVSYLMLLDSNSKQSQTDLIVNGSLGRLVLNDSDMDTLHVSTINANDGRSLVNIDASDYLLVFLNPDKGQGNSGVISVDTNKIYPYFGNYVELTSQTPTSNLGTVAVQNEIDTSYITSAFANTIGNIESYVVQDNNRQLSTVQSGLGMIEVKIDKTKFASEVSNYINKIGEFSQQNKSKFLEICPTEDEYCMNQAGYVSADDIQNTEASITAFISIFDFDKTAILVDPNTLEFKGIVADMKQTNNIVDKINFPFSNMTLSFSFYTVTPNEKEVIFQPLSSIKPDLVPSAESSGTADMGNTLYASNRAYMRALDKGIWEAISTSGDKFCNLNWNPKFCLKNLPDWNIYYFGDNQISMHYPYPSGDDANQSNIQIDIDKPYDNPEDLKNLEIWKCDIDRDSTGNKPDFKSIVTEQGIQLALVSYGFSGGYWDGDVCLNSNGVYKHLLPFGTVNIMAKNMQIDEVYSKIEPWLKTLTIDTEIKPEWTELAPPKAAVMPFPEKKQSVEISQMQFSETENGEYITSNVLVVNKADLHNGKDCLASIDYIIESYGVDPKIKDSVFPNNQAVCFSDYVCWKCENGSFQRQSDLTACRGLRCNPN